MGPALCWVRGYVGEQNQRDHEAYGLMGSQEIMNDHSGKPVLVIWGL